MTGWGMANSADCEVDSKGITLVDTDGANVAIGGRSTGPQSFNREGK